MSKIPNPFTAVSQQLYNAVDHLQERKIHQEQFQQAQKQVIRLNKELMALKKQYNSYRHEERELEEDLGHVRNKSRKLKQRLIQMQEVLAASTQRMEQLQNSLLEYSILRYGREKGEHGIRQLGHYTAQGMRFVLSDLQKLLGKKPPANPQLAHRKKVPPSPSDSPHPAKK